MSDHEYRIKAITPNGERTTPAVNDPKHAGDLYRQCKKNNPPGTEISLQKRPVGEWEDVEKETT